MKKETIEDFHYIMNTFGIIIMAMKWIQKEKDNYDFDEIIKVSEILHKNIMIFCINNIGDIEETFS